MPNITNPNSERQLIKQLSVQLYTGQITLEEIKMNHIDLYVSNMDLFHKVQKQHFLDFNPEPEKRINILLTGADPESITEQVITGGTGKSIITKKLIKKFYKPNERYKLEDLDSGFIKYTNQKCIFWNEFRSEKIQDFSFSKFFAITDISDEDLSSEVNIKFGSVKLCHEMNVFNTSQEFKQFMNGCQSRHYILNSEGQKVLSDPENFSQIERRFPVVFTLEKKLIENQSNQYETILTCRKHNDTIKSDKEFSQYEKYFVLKFPTNKENYKTQLSIVSNFIFWLIDPESYEWKVEKSIKYLKAQRDLDSITKEEIEDFYQTRIEEITTRDKAMFLDSLPKNELDWKLIEKDFKE